jgi:hypothetical protein
LVINLKNALAYFGKVLYDNFFARVCTKDLCSLDTKVIKGIGATKNKKIEKEIPPPNPGTSATNHFMVVII